MKYLVTGGWGKLGSELRDKLPALVPTKAELNILDERRLVHFASQKDIGAILHLAAVSDSAAAAKDKPTSYAVNVRGTATVAKTARHLEKKLIYVSSDYVFPGTAGDYTERDAPEPANWYGFTKYAGELEVQHCGGAHLIIRTAFRPSVWPFASAYSDVYTSADYVDVIAREILLALTMNLHGIIHIGTPKKTLFELAKRRNPAIVAEASPKDFPKRKDLATEKWEEIKRGSNQQSV